MAWPDTARKRLTYILVAPLLIPMWLTLPDTRTPKGKKLFPITFIGSILWIAAFSYLMVWWANVAGDTARIPPEVSLLEGGFFNYPSRASRNKCGEIMNNKLLSPPFSCFAIILGYGSNLPGRRYIYSRSDNISYCGAQRFW